MNVTVSRHSREAENKWWVKATVCCSRKKKKKRNKMIVLNSQPGSRLYAACVLRCGVAFSGAACWCWFVLKMLTMLHSLCIHNTYMWYKTRPDASHSYGLIRGKLFYDASSWDVSQYSLRECYRMNKTRWRIHLPGCFEADSRTWSHIYLSAPSHSKCQV